MPKVDEFKEKVKNIWKDLAKKFRSSWKIERAIIRARKRALSRVKKRNENFEWKVKSNGGQLSDNERIINPSST